MTLATAHALYTAEQVRALDRFAIEQSGIPGYELMHRAAAAALDELCTRWPQVRHARLLCGPGNNGGDAFLLGALARARGLQVDALALSDDARGDAAQARRAFVDAGGTVHAADASISGRPDVYVDGLFGTGLSRPPEGAAARLIERVGASALPVLALDIPSGLDADTGVARAPTVRADATVSFVAWKRGLFTGAAADHVGALSLDTLDLGPEVYASQAPDAALMQPHGLPPRRRASHKGEHGHLLAIGGDAGTGGAIRMAGEAALRCGAGLVSVATRRDHIVALNAARPELMAHAVEEADALAPLLRRADVLALGPGLGQAEWGHALWTAALAARRPAVLDADALNLLARQPRRLDMPAVLTPHPGEAARLLGCGVPEIESDRFAAARELAARFGAVTVLKGAGSLVAAPGGELAVCPWGNPGMAGGGMGDVLTGTIAALLAQGLRPWNAACLGVGLHARAGDRAAAAGERGLLATDLLPHLRHLVNARDD